MKQCLQNKEKGKEWELIFIKQCQMQGIAVTKSPLSAEWVGQGRLQLKTSALDFELIHKGTVVKIDTKALEEDKVRWSDLTIHQTEKSKWYMEQGINSGLVVWHTTSNHVVFYSGELLSALEKGKSFLFNRGEFLGTFEDFALGNLFK